MSFLVCDTDVDNRYGRRMTCLQNMEASCLAPFQTLPYVLFHLVVLVCIFCNKTVIIHVPCMSFVNHPSELSSLRELMRISEFITYWPEVVV